MRHVLLACLVLALMPSPASAAEEMRIDTRDGTRLTLIVPAARTPAPTVIVLHGATLTAHWTLSHSGFAEAAAAHGFSAAYPDGFYRQWNDGREGRKDVDDVAFLRLLAQQLIERRIADPQRLYIAGISNGGMMTLRMVCEAAELFAGTGTIIANMPLPTGESCRPSRPVPLVMFNGTADPLVPYGGGGVGFLGRRGKVWGTERTAEFIARANGCAGSSRSMLQPRGPDERTDIERLQWSACSGGAEVTLYRIGGGGHQVFGATNFMPVMFGPGTDQISAARTIMDAFAGRR